jgi:heat shock protein HslJ
MNYLNSLSRHLHVVVAVFLAGLILVTGCIDLTEDEPPTGGSETIPPLTVETLKNALYRGIYTDPVQLTDGQYEGEPFVEGGASRPTVYITDASAFADLNGDGLDDAVVVLIENSGGSGNFRYLAVVLNQDGDPENVATGLLGDRAQVQSITVDGPDITIEAVAHGPDDPMCCPTQKIIITYRFDGEQLVKVSEETATAEAPATTPATIEGTRWTLLSYLNSEGETVHILPGTAITAEFTPDQIAGSAGCNNYFGSYQVEGAGITFGPLGSTQMWCAEPDGTMAQEGDYLAALEAATAFQVAGDTLTLTNADGDPIATFAQATGSDIVGIVWTWERFDDTAGVKDIVVDDPNYTLTLHTDGTYQVQADCNLSSGSYTLEGSRLTLLPGPTTLAECAPGSLYDEYLTRLGDVVTFVLDGEKLVLNLKADAGNMVFASGTDEETETITSSPVSPEQIVDVIWQWTELIETEPASQSLVTDPENYTLVLHTDGTYQIKADCNLSSGGYVLEGNSLTLLPGPTTLAECGPDSLYDEYLAFLGQVATIELDGDKFILNLKDGVGKMGFVKGVPEKDYVDITWQWTELIETEPASQSLVPNPENYTLVLRSDGTYQIKADCNVGGGGYTLEGNNLTLGPGPMTAAECGPESLFDLYLTALGSVESISMQDGNLVLHLSGNAGEMVFHNAGPAAETGGETAGADITGRVWSWVETITPVDVTSVDDPEKYTLELLPDGQFHVKADCNSASGSYTLDDSHLSFEFGPMTLAQCEPGSLSDQFIKDLSAAAIYFLKGEELFIDLIYDSGTMRFAPGA